MQNQLNSFQFGGNPIRVVQSDDGEPLWVAKDVLEALGYTWAGSASVKHIPEEWRRVNSELTPPGTNGMWLLTEQISAAIDWLGSDWQGKTPLLEKR